jgi:uncharacterized protein YutE (UPF0331/DUF86 family)
VSWSHAVVDKVLLASKVAAVRDAVARIQAVLPPDVNAFVDDRTAREIVILNLFVALQDCVALAAHWLADRGLDVPQTYGDVFRRLGDQDVLPKDLAIRLASASGFRNLVAHQYGVMDWTRVHTIATERLDDLLAFCDELTRRAQ